MIPRPKRSLALPSRLVVRLAVPLLAALLLSPAARAQEAPNPELPPGTETPSVPPAPDASEAAPPQQAGEPPYEGQLLRLSEILGAVYYLRQLCDSDEGPLWRDQMQALIDTEHPNPIRRARFVDRFNRGYESYRSVYRSCTTAAATAIDRYMDEGVKIARDITARYGP
jgi:uncharacterized protein (TIGR02301 family)